MGNELTKNFQQKLINLKKYQPKMYQPIKLN